MFLNNLYRFKSGGTSLKNMKLLLKYFFGETENNNQAIVRNLLCNDIDIDNSPMPG
jgi:hypothetical protein